MPSRKDRIWNKARPIRGKNPNLYRRDDEGNTLYKPSYGKDSEMGWHMDHIQPKSKGGSDRDSNLRPLQSRANRSRGNGRISQRRLDGRR